ncbi:MAG: hypothetical protein P8O79_02270 [Halieaceae bacterium]|nr:hypothetical protein [Halieaceae bacterium]
MLGLTITDKQFPSLRATALGWCLLLLSACGANQVIVDSQFPQPALDPIPVTMGVYFSEDFKTHTFVDKPEAETERDWIVETGAAQVSLWQTILNAMFEQVVYLEQAPSTETPSAQVQSVLIPTISDLQYAIPAHTNTKVFELWLKYDIALTNSTGDPLAQWSMTAYGKTPEAFMQSNQDAVGAAAIVALRDAGANFAVNFPKVPAVSEWLKQADPGTSLREDAP